MFPSISTVFACLAFATLLFVCESQVASLCRPNEVLRECGGCQRTCRDPNPVCTNMCHMGCYCDGEDLVRDDNGICIKFEECPKKYHKREPPALEICREDEVFEHCGVCDRSCDNPNPICPAQCKRGCFCKEGLVRNRRTGQCVPEDRCPNVPQQGITLEQDAEEECEDDEVYEHCGVCEPSCENPNPICPAQCKRGCFCRKGLFRDQQTDRCVLHTSCTNNENHEPMNKECEDNEIFEYCGICEPTCHNLTPICPAECKRGCFCKDEFVRDRRTNKCVPRSRCSQNVF